MVKKKKYLDYVPNVFEISCCSSWNKCSTEFALFSAGYKLQRIQSHLHKKRKARKREKSERERK
jgi:predicted heme/steroid binding protein